MVTDVEYMQIISEEYDLSDYNTKKKLLFCNEAKRIDNLEHIVNNLYLNIKGNVAGIDFGTIPKSKGVVTRVENYANLLDCINSVHELIYNYHEKTDIPDALSTALANIRQRERTFTKAFALNIEFPIMIYNMTVLSVVSGVSLLLSASIEYVKNGHDSFAVSFDKVGYTKSRDHVLYQYINQFNRNCDNGTLDRLMAECIKNNLTPASANVNESSDVVNEGLKDIASIGVGASISGALINAGKKFANTPFGKVVLILGGAIAGIITFLKVMKMAAFWWYRTRQNISDWFDQQATYLQINAENLKYRDDDRGEDHKKRTYQSQMRWVERFKKWANKFSIADSKARKEAKDEYDRERRRKYDDDDNSSDDSLF